MSEPAEMAAAVLACARVEGNRAAMDLYLALSKEGLSLLDVDLAAGRSECDLRTLDYLRQGQAALAHLHAAVAKLDRVPPGDEGEAEAAEATEGFMSAARINGDYVHSLFVQYMDQKGKRSK